jgi:hypothetical protein
MARMPDLKTYKRLQPVIHTGDLVEWRSASALGAAIRWFTKKDVNHSSLVARFDYAGLEDRRFVFEAMGDGLDFNLLSERMQQFKGRVYWYGLKPSITDIGFVRERMLSKALMLKAQHVKYDYWGLFRNAAARVSVNARQLFCSEFYQVCGIYAGIYTDQIARRPGEFAAFKRHLPRVEIWEGAAQG